MTNDDKPTLQRCKRRLDKTKQSALSWQSQTTHAWMAKKWTGNSIADKNDLMKNASKKLIEDKDNRAPTIREAMYNK